jgi:hypothetical protein
VHPFLAHYQTKTNKSQEAGDEDCTNTGTTGAWNAASGSAPSRWATCGGAEGRNAVMRSALQYLGAL